MRVKSDFCRIKMILIYIIQERELKKNGKKSY